MSVSRSTGSDTGSPAWRLSLQPRQWQERALAEWLNAGRRGICAVVTGAGKTLFAEMCIMDFSSTSPGACIVVIVPTQALLDQWYVSLREDLGILPQELATFSGEGKATSPARINILVLNTAREWARRLTTHVSGLLIVDECHRAASPMNAEALVGNYSCALGLSATPRRDYDQGLDEYLVPVLGPVIFRYDYADARAEGTITPFRIVNVHFSLTATERRRYDHLSRQIALAIRRAQGDLADDTVRMLLSKRAKVYGGASVRVPLAARLVDDLRGERVLVFHENVAAADELLSLLRKRRHEATIYHSQLSPALRRDNLRLFRRGAFDVLICCRALDEGMNIPETTAAVIASSTASSRQRIQRLGRVLRPARGKTAAVIYTLYATEVEQRRLEAEASMLQRVADVDWLEATSSRG